MAEPGAIFRAERVSKIFDLSPPLFLRLLTGGGRVLLPAVDGVSLSVEKGRTFGLVGESGCGKSTLARLAVGLMRPSAGSIAFSGRPVRAPGGGGALGRGRLQMIFQDPFASLNPRWRVRDIIAEPMRARGLSRAERRARAGELLEQVGLAAADGEKFPHEFSGGQRQRISIARALASEPDFLVLDEPTSALDVSVQAQILNLMRDLQERLGLTYLFISHDLAVISHVADRVGVMYLGRIVETAEAEQLFREPRHPYTRLLMDAVPDLDRRGIERRAGKGDVANPLNRPSGCHFHPRCPYANERCRVEDPKLLEDAKGAAACHAVEEGRLPKWEGT
ncbi:MAG: ABC transporter ATP-binding protein [Alphaproteobacteria bacterium]